MLIKSIGLYHTPESWDELIEWINMHHSSDRPHLLTAAGMAWNLAAKAVELVEDVEDA